MPTTPLYQRNLTLPILTTCTNLPNFPRRPLLPRPRRHGSFLPAWPRCSSQPSSSFSTSSWPHSDIWLLPSTTQTANSLSSYQCDPCDACSRPSPVNPLLIHHPPSYRHVHEAPLSIRPLPLSFPTLKETPLHPLNKALLPILAPSLLPTKMR